MSQKQKRENQETEPIESQAEQPSELGVEFSDDQVLQNAEALVSRFENEQSNTLANIAADATGGDVGLSNEELKQIKEQSGINTKLDSLAQKARELLDALKEKALDY